MAAIPPRRPWCSVSRKAGTLAGAGARSPELGWLPRVCEAWVYLEDRRPRKKPFAPKATARHRHLPGIVRPDYQRAPRPHPARLANVDRKSVALVDLV